LQKKESSTWIDEWKVECGACVLVSVKAHEVPRKVGLSYNQIIHRSSFCVFGLFSQVDVDQKFPKRLFPGCQ
jgi:hypothetical protein